MAQCTAPAEPHILPPPIPIRSHLRSGSAYQRKLVGATLEGKSMISTRASLRSDGGKEGDTMTMGRRTDDTLEDDCSCEDASEVSYCDGYPRPLQSDLSKIHSETSIGCIGLAMGDPSKGLVKQIEMQGRVPSPRGSPDGGTASATCTNRASYSNNTLSSSSDYSVEKMNTNVSAWLAQGFLGPDSEEPSSPRQATSNSDRPFPSRHFSLSLFPPKSPLTGKRECTPPGSPFSRPICPVSPLSNGRDVYGNYIASNKQDYLTAHSSPTSSITRVISESQKISKSDISSPLVRLRGGGWNGFKSFWKTVDTEELDETLGPTSPQDSVDKDSIFRDVPPIHYAGRPESQGPRSVRSQFPITRAGRIDRTTEGTSELSSAIDTRRDGQHFEWIDISQGSNTPDSSDTNDSSIRKARTEAVFSQYFGPQLSPAVLIAPETRPFTIREPPMTYSQADVPTRDGARSPLIDTTVASRNHVVSPRCNKRWASERPPPPPKLPPPNPPRRLPADPSEDDAFESSDDDSRRAPSLLSASTVDDDLMDVLGLEKTDAYKRVEHERAIQRIQAERRVYEEADRIRDVNIKQDEELQRREPDLSTMVPGDSFTAARTRQSVDKQHDFERWRVSGEHRPHSPPKPSQYLPRYGHITTEAQVVPQHQNAQYRTIGYPSIVSTPQLVDSAPIKRQNSLQTVISKAGEITRFILAAPSGSRYKTYSKRDPPMKCQEIKPSGLGADATGWPRNGKSFCTATNGMLISTQAPYSSTAFPHIQPPNRRYDRIQSDSRGWEHPRGRRVKKVKEAENKKQGGKWGRCLKKNTSLGDTNVVDMASRSMQGSGSSPTPVADTSSRTTRPRAATQLQHPEFARSGLRARSLSPRAPTLVTGSLSLLAPESQQLEHTFTTIQKSGAVGTLQPRFDLPDSRGRCYVRRDNGEVLPLNPVRPPYCDGLNTYHGSDNPDAATLKWLEGTRAPAGPIAKPVVNMRGGDVTSTTGEASSLASHYCSLTSEATGLNSGNEIIDSSDVDALLVPSTHLNIDEVINVDDTRPGLDEANVRSSFSTDSTIELRRKKKAEKNIWRNEDQARAMAMAMHSIS